MVKAFLAGFRRAGALRPLRCRRAPAGPDSSAWELELCAIRAAGARRCNQIGMLTRLGLTQIKGGRQAQA